MDRMVQIIGPDGAVELTDSEQRYLAMHARYEAARHDDIRYRWPSSVKQKERWQKIADALHPDPWKVDQ